MSAAPRAATSMRAATPGYPPYDALAFDVPVLPEGDVNARVWIRIREIEQSLALIDADSARLPRRPGARGRCRRAPARAWRWSKAFRGDVFVWLRLGRRAGSSAAICATRPGSSGRCWKPRSRATSSPTSRSATSPSTAPTRGTTCRRHADARCCKACSIARSPSRRRAPTRPKLAELAQRARTRRAQRGSAAASRSARSMPAPATAASWRSTRSTTRSTTSSASACASSPRRATPTCCSSPAR